VGRQESRTFESGGSSLRDPFVRIFLRVPRGTCAYRYLGSKVHYPRASRRDFT
jgi:hypothetical protein